MVQSVLSSYFLLLFGLAEAELKNSPNYPEETLELFILQMIFFFFFLNYYILESKQLRHCKDK